jgi:LytR cell envelope-related transcriptional attenuator
MSSLTFALSLSSTFTKIGAIAAFAALVGIAILSLLVFSQARELKRLREWAGRAPERAADLEQRVSSAAAARVQQQAPAQTARPVARAAPIAASPPAGPPPPAAPPQPGLPGQPPTPVPSPVSAPGSAPAPQPASANGAPLQPAAPGAPPATSPAQPVGAPASAAAAAHSRVLPGAPDPRAASSAAASSPPAAAALPAASPPAPATVAAAGVTAARAPSPPAPPRTAAQQPAASQQAASSAPVSAQRRPLPPAPPPAVTGAAAGAPARTQAARAGQGIPPALESRSIYAAERSRGRTIALLAAAAVVVVAAVAVALLALGGSSSPKHTASTATSTTHQTVTTHAKRPPHKAAKPAPKTPAVSPAETNVAVLNATEAEGLAHRTASTLQQNGYSQATALSGKPPGSGQVTVVEYSSGHQAEAEGVAHSLSVAHVLPIEAAVTALAGSAGVVVVVGADREHETSSP